MGIPMRLKEERTIHTGCSSRNEVEDRLLGWAERYGFAMENSVVGDFVFRRGSHWRALYTFDLRKIPTVVAIDFDSANGEEVTCRMQCGSWLQFSTPGDPKRLAEQMDLLEACLKGALP
jgi:hypothetical protein